MKYVHVPKAARFVDNPGNSSARSASCRLNQDFGKLIDTLNPMSEVPLHSAQYNQSDLTRLVIPLGLQKSNCDYESAQWIIEAMGVKPLVTCPSLQLTENFATHRSPHTLIERR